MPDTQTDYLINGPAKRCRATLVLAHGAGAPMDSPFLEAVAQSLARRKFKIVRFEFPYMSKRRLTGKKSGPNGMKILEASWLDVIEEFGAEGLFIGGKSMGGRVASQVADQAGVSGVICLGYPFHPPGKPAKLRIRSLETSRTPVLICQGERDPFGNTE
ncbi:MAG: alpha/beta family hydrolase, partial [Planctomycetota bacterium]|nr:alpha/beta family hydrolase [Planctomycetota bacterium]